MKKRKGLIICWSAVLIVCVLGVAGINITEKTMINAILKNVSMEQTVKYVPRVMWSIGKSDGENMTDRDKKGTLLITALLSDKEDKENNADSDNEMPCMTYISMITDKDGNLIFTGSKAAVEKENCNDEMSKCIETICGYISVDEHIPSEQRIRMEEIIGSNHDYLVRVDSYVMEGNECIPLSITILKSDGTTVESIDCSSLCTDDLINNKVNGAPLYVHQPYSVNWESTERMDKGRDFLENWIKTNPNLDNEEIICETNYKEGYSIFYSIESDCSYYTLVYIDFNDNGFQNIFVFLIFLMVGISCFVGVIVTVIIYSKCKK